jgi:hypothetical protein
MAGSSTKPGGTTPDVENFPGFVFLERVTTAASRAVLAHARALNDTWSEIREGTSDASTYMKMWARIAENYYDVAEELWRPPNLGRAPAWFLIPYQIKVSPATYDIPLNEALDAGASLDITTFGSVGDDGNASGGITVQNMLTGPPKAAGRFIEIELNQPVVDKLVSGTSYLAFVFRTGSSAVPPLAAIVIRVKS